jgi:hypothetical protein
VVFIASGDSLPFALDRDMYLIGYCPQYLRADILWLLLQKRNLRITVDEVNLPPAPIQFRVMCRAVMAGITAGCDCNRGSSPVLSNVITAARELIIEAQIQGKIYMIVLATQLPSGPPKVADELHAIPKRS